MDFLPEEIEHYAAIHTQVEPALLAALNRQTWEQALMPRMLSGHVQGRILSMLSKMIRPKYVLEIGTFTGYSALCFAEGLQKDGELHTIDINDELGGIVRRYFGESDYSSQLHYHLGDARELIKTLDFEWDLVFLDADKVSYKEYYNFLLPKLRSGAIIIADNVLWSGKVVEPEKYLSDKDLQALVAFNDYVNADSRVENVLFAVRDGLMVIRKI